jgi:hypothetical protein
MLNAASPEATQQPVQDREYCAARRYWCGHI